MIDEMSQRVSEPSELGKVNHSHKQVHWRKGIDKIIIALLCTLVALLVAFFPLVATTQTQPLTTVQAQPENQSRRERGNQVINKLSGGAGQPVLDALRQDFPFLADAITNYALGEVWSRRGLD